MAVLVNFLCWTNIFVNKYIFSMQPVCTWSEVDASVLCFIFVSILQQNSDRHHIKMERTLHFLRFQNLRCGNIVTRQFSLVLGFFIDEQRMCWKVRAVKDNLCHKLSLWLLVWALLLRQTGKYIIFCHNKKKTKPVLSFLGVVGWPRLAAKHSPSCSPTLPPQQNRGENKARKLMSQNKTERSLTNCPHR